jgi:hypothetical protein
MRRKKTTTTNIRVGDTWSYYCDCGSPIFIQFMVEDKTPYLDTYHKGSKVVRMPVNQPIASIKTTAEGILTSTQMTFNDEYRELFKRCGWTYKI